MAHPVASGILPCESGGIPACESGGIPACESGGIPACESSGIPQCESGGIPQCESPGILSCYRTYKGSKRQKLFLTKLSKTYLMLFMLQCDPKVSAYFQRMASELKLYVCTSILVPVLSECFLEEESRRHSNLLSQSNTLGVELLINEGILNELINHLVYIKKEYKEEYFDCEDIFLENKMLIQYIDHILIRAYFYAKCDGKVRSFEEYLDEFVSPSLENAKEDIITWLEETFGILYLSTKPEFDEKENESVETLCEKLIGNNRRENQARHDSKLFIEIYHRREKNNEISNKNVFGYKTWWLSKDTLTQKTALNVLDEKYKKGCCMRPDFLYNYISFSPNARRIKDTFDSVFTGLVGINISNNLPKKIISEVNDYIREHKNKNPARVKSIMNELSDRLKTKFDIPDDTIKEILEK